MAHDATPQDAEPQNTARRKRPARSAAAHSAAAHSAAVHSADARSAAHSAVAPSDGPALTGGPSIPLVTADEAKIKTAVVRCLEISENRLTAQTDWYADLSDSDKALLHRVFEAAVHGFVDWVGTYVSPQEHAPINTDHIFFVAPVEFMRSIKLSQTLDATRVIVDVITENLDMLSDNSTVQQDLMDAALIYSRSVAFSAAEVYANAAEVRGTWDARDEAFVVESLLMGDTGQALQARMASFQWTPQTYSVAFVGKPDASGDLRAGMQQDRLRRRVSSMGGYVCMSRHRDLLVTLFGSPEQTIPSVDPDHSAKYNQELAKSLTSGRQASAETKSAGTAGAETAGAGASSAGTANESSDTTMPPSTMPPSGTLPNAYDLVLGTARASADERITLDSLTRLALPLFDADSAVCVGPVRQGFDGASATMRAALNGYYAAVTIADCPRPLSSDDVLPERALFGDADARRELYEGIYQTLKQPDEKNVMLETVKLYLFNGGSLDKTAQQLSVHPNTVRYRLRRSVDLTGWDPTDPREAYVLLTALKIGMCKDSNPDL